MRFRDAYDPSRALQQSWLAIRRAPLPLLLGGFLLTLFDPSNGGSGYQIQSDRFDPNVFVFFAGIGGCVSLILLALSSWIYAGFVGTVRKALVTGACDIGDIFSDRDRWLPLIGARILRFLAIGAAAAPLVLIAAGGALMHEEFRVEEDVVVGSAVLAGLMYLPVLGYVALGLMLIKPAVVLDRLGPVQAMKRSWALMARHRLWFLLYFVLTTVAYLLGFFLCCVGIVGTAGWVEVAYIESYLSLTRGEERDGWWIANPDQPAPAPVAADFSG